MNRIYGVLIFLVIFMLTSCGQPPETTQDELPEEKQELIITTKAVSDFSRDITITKTGIVQGSSSIQINTQASGQVGDIYVQEGDFVSAGQALMRINDTIANYNLSTQSAANSLESSQINREKTIISLDKAVLDAQIALEKAQADLENTREVVKKQIATAERNAQNATAEDNITKAQLDFDTFLKNTQETLDGFERTFASEKTKLQNFLTNTIDTTDQLLGVSITYSQDNDMYEDYLGARNRANKNLAESSLRSLIYAYENFQGTTPTRDLQSRVQTLENMYDTTTNTLNYTEQVLIDTIPSDFFTTAEIASYRSSIDGLQATLQANKAGLISFLNNATSFLATYEQNIATQEAALALQIRNITTGEGNASDSLEQARNSVAQQIRAAENLVQTTQNALENAQKTRDITIAQLENQVASAQIQLTQSQTQTGKLTVRSPIEGVVGSILVDKGQEVGPGTPSISLESPQSIFEILVDSTVVTTLEVGQKVGVVYKNTSHTGVITSISPRANAGLQYSVTITFDNDAKFLGDFAEALIPIRSPYTIIPLKHVNIISQSQGNIWVLEGGDVVRKNVVIGSIWGDQVEVISGIDDDTVIITSNMSNYNPETFTISIES